MTTTGTYAERTQAILDDLAAGLRPFEVVQKHGVSKQWVYQIRTRAGLALPLQCQRCRNHLNPRR